MKYSRNFYQIKSNQEIFEQIKEEKKDIGYYDLPYQNTTDIKDYARTVKQKHIVIIGIGGSSLGTYAIYNFLKHTNEYTKKLHFLESTDPIELNARIKKIDLDDALFIVISKSGTTIETISIFKYLHSLLTIDKSNCLIITEDDSKLNTYAQKHSIKTFDIPKDVGGRFSVFSSVGLIPLSIIGIDIDKLLSGCAEVSDSYFAQENYYDEIMTKSRFMVENKNKFNINVLFSYSSLLEGFNKWYIQLWGESLGKININNTKQALTPIGLIGPVDQHSFLQLIIEGKRDKTVTFIKVENFESDTIIPSDTLDGFDDLNYIDNIKFSDIINHQANATIEAVKDIKDIPCDIISIEKVDEQNIGKLMFTFQLLTSVIGQFVQINTYDQPGVENGKIILKETLKGRYKST